MSNAEMTAVVETNQPLRVAILSDSDKQRANLKILIETSGMSVVKEQRLCAASIRSLDSNETDVLLVDMDDEAEHELDFLDELLDSPIPILFNDAPSTRMKAAQTDSDWGRKLTQKLSSIVEQPGNKRDSVEIADIIVNPVDLSIDETIVEHEPVFGTSNEYLVEAEYLEEIEQRALHRAEDEISHEENDVSIAEGSVITAGIAARNVWVIGASIGGPQSVKRFLAAIQTRLPVAFVLAQHIGSNFVSLLAKQLDKVSGMKVIAATEGHLLKHNEVVIAPTSQRITLDKQGFIRLKPLEAKSIYTPSIDTVMTDISMRYGVHTSSIMFSGMGCDGVRGSQLIASRGGRVWAQDTDSCVISSMPDSTRRAGIVGFNGTPEELATQLTGYFKSHTR